MLGRFTPGHPGQALAPAIGAPWGFATRPGPSESRTPVHRHHRARGPPDRDQRTHPGQLFRTELGVTYPQWRTLVRVFHAMALLSAGASVTQTSHRCGWATPSAFIDTFTRTHGPDTRLLFRTTVSPPAPFPSRAHGRNLRIHHSAPRQSTRPWGDGHRPDEGRAAVDGPDQLVKRRI